MKRVFLAGWLWLGLYVGVFALGNWTAPRPGLTQMPAPHGPTMPPDPGEPFR